MFSFDGVRGYTLHEGLWFSGVSWKDLNLEKRFELVLVSAIPKGF